MKHAWVNRVGMLSLVGVMVLAGDTYAGSNSYPVGARVLDATYKVVGPVLGTDSGVSNPNVALNISGTSIVLQVTRNLFGTMSSIFHRGELQRASVHRNRVNTSFNGGAREGTARATRSGGVADEHGEA